ncbi:MAG TPA: phosphoribosylglycinamide formyltransferase [Anaerolineae bacterium]|nr:phosphoribosylglycinamide formyltransferase [Anaerolineae bacterium]
MTKPRIVVLVSGGGTNLQAIIDAQQTGEIDADIVAVVSNKRQAYGLTRAENANIPTLYFPLLPYKKAGKSREQYDADLAAKVAEYEPDLIVLAGWMHILSPSFLTPFRNQVINLHPALPGAFDGINAIERTFAAYQAGEVTHGGCMVHIAIPEVDAGPVIIQEEIPIHTDDTLETFATRLHAVEHRLIVTAVKKMLAQL